MCPVGAEVTVSVPGRLQANLITFNSVISACAKGADSWSLYALHFGENINSIYIYINLNIITLLLFGTYCLQGISCVPLVLCAHETGSWCSHGVPGDCARTLPMAPQASEDPKDQTCQGVAEGLGVDRGARCKALGN